MWKRTGILVLSLLFASTAAHAQESAPPVISFDKLWTLHGVVPRKTQWYEIDKAVEILPPYYRFTVRCEHASYVVVSSVRLLKLCHEIQVLEAYRRMKSESEVWEGMRSSARELGHGARQLAVHPGLSGEALMRNLGRSGRSVGRFFARPFRGTPVASNGIDRSQIPGSGFAAPHARIFAYRHGLDVYSDNPVVREVIAEVAASHWKGSAGVTVASWAVLPFGIGVITRGAMTPGAWDEEAEVIIRDNAPAELARVLRLRFKNAFALNREIRADRARLREFDRFLANPNYSPREKAYITFELESLNGLARYDEVVRFLAEARTVEQAIFLAQQLELLGAWHRQGEPFYSFAVMGNRVGGLSGAGELVMIMTQDIVDDTDETRMLRRQFSATAAVLEAKRASLWLVGTATREFHRVARNDGILLIEGLLADPVFQPARRTDPFCARGP